MFLRRNGFRGTYSHPTGRNMVNEIVSKIFLHSEEKNQNQLLKSAKNHQKQLNRKGTNHSADCLEENYKKDSKRK